MIKIQFIGNLGKDAEVKTTQGGKSYLSFSVGVSETRQGGQSETTWLNCSAWSENMVNGKLKGYLKKGTKVYVEGKPTPRAYNNQAGEAVVSNDVMVNMVELCGGQTQQKTAPAQTPTPQPARQPEAQGFGDNPNMGDDLPF